MKKKYETLDDYLDDLDAIKAKIADRTRGMTTKEVLAYFAGAERRLYELTGRKLRRRRAKRKPHALNSRRGAGHGKRKSPLTVTASR
jgi:hypothetical protein